MRRRTWISVWDAFGYLVWGYGWAVGDPAWNLPNVQGMHLGVDQPRMEPLAAPSGPHPATRSERGSSLASPWDSGSGSDARFDRTQGARGAPVTGSDEYRTG